MNAARHTIGLCLLLFISGPMLSGCDVPDALNPIKETVKSWLPGNTGKTSGKETATATGTKTTIASPPYIPELPAEEPIEDVLDPEFYDADLEHILLEGGPTEDDPTAEQDELTPGTIPNPQGEATFEDSSLDSHRTSNTRMDLRKNPLAGEAPMLPSQLQRLQKKREAEAAAKKTTNKPAAALPMPGPAAKMTTSNTVSPETRKPGP